LSAISEFAHSMMSYAPAIIVAERPSSNSGFRWIDLRLNGRFSAVSWQPGKGFGFYDESDPGFGEEVPRRLLADPVAAASYEAEVLLSVGWPLVSGPVSAQALRVR